MNYIGKLFAGVACMVLISAGGAAAQAGLQAETPPAKVIINIPSRTLSFYEMGKLVKEYPVGIGRADHQTPLGHFKISYKEVNPIWIEPTEPGAEPYTIPSGPRNPLGYRWMEFAPYYGIHGTNRPDSIGHYVSNGCVRMFESDVEELYEKVPFGMPVEIRYERVLIKEGGDRNLTLYIYPDTYGLQPLSAAAVYARLRGYQAADMVSRADIEMALVSNRAEEFRLGRIFSLMVFGKKIAAKGFSCGGEDYLPVASLGAEAMVDVTWDAASGMLKSPYGEAPGKIRNDRLYVQAKNVYALFHLYGRWYPSPDTFYIDKYHE